MHLCARSSSISIVEDNNLLLKHLQLTAPQLNEKTLGSPRHEMQYDATSGDRPWSAVPQAPLRLLALEHLISRLALRTPSPETRLEFSDFAAPAA